MFKKPVYEAPVMSDTASSTQDDVETVVGPSVTVEGDFASEGNIVVKGTVSGSVKTSKLLTVEKGAKILANVRAGNAIISGSVKGNVKVHERLDLYDTAQVSGDVDCKILSVMAGALIQGKLTMKGIDVDEGEKKPLFSKTKEKKEEIVTEFN